MFGLENWYRIEVEVRIMGKLLRIEDKFQQLSAYFSAEPIILGVLIFGSYYTDYYNERSDIDFGIIYDDGRNVQLFKELEIEDNISQIVQTDRIDVINLNKSPLVFAHKALRTGKIIYERDPILVSDYLERIYNLYCDYEFVHRKFFKEYEDSLKEDYLNGR